MSEKNDLLRNQSQLQTGSISSETMKEVREQIDKPPAIGWGEVSTDVYAKDKAIIEKCSQTGEPTFCLRAQDEIARKIIGAYLEEAKARGCSDEFILDVTRVFDRFANWAGENSDKMKLPD